MVPALELSRVTSTNMDEIAISLKNVSKCFKRYAHPGDRLQEVILPSRKKAEEFWALKDINLDVPKGQTIGIIGRNGSGKSTLLQIIAGTLTPTTGTVQTNGRIAALLELGSGFNPEFTGRQNIFFNGRLLGLDQREIQEKFDEIAAFADIGAFIDQPVKTYSSGMAVRLAFAVSTSVEPEIFIIDEALAVGDEAFQRKCFARIQSIQERGGTILFVSHSASTIVELCRSAILIDHAELLLSGPPKLVISKYQKLIYAPAEKLDTLRQEIQQLNKQPFNHLEENALFNQANGNHYKLDHKNTKPAQPQDKAEYDPGLVPQSTISYVSHGAEIKSPHITTLDGRTVNVLCQKSEYIYTYSVSFTRSFRRVRCGMMIKTITGFELGGAVSHPLSQPIEFLEAGEQIQVKFKFRCLLQPGVYFLNAGVVGEIDGAEVFLDRHIDVAMFRVQPEENSVETGIVDFCIEPDISYSNTDVIVENGSLEPQNGHFEAEKLLHNGHRYVSRAEV